MRLSARLAATALLALATTACTPAATTPGSPAGNSTVVTPPGSATQSEGAESSAASATSALVVLAGLTVAEESSGDTYARSDFGPTWSDVDSNGCSTRDDILTRDLADAVVDTDGCAVLYGTLHDPYSGQSVQFSRGVETSRLVPIDHRVPLKEAWRSGADSWTAQQRLQFANDPENLVATTEAENSAKSDSDPSSWLPTSTTAWCDYTSRYVAAKAVWNLSIDSAERDALSRVLRTC